jgi:hypothetical protein
MPATTAACPHSVCRTAGRDRPDSNVATRNATIAGPQQRQQVAADRDPGQKYHVSSKSSGVRLPRRWRQSMAVQAIARDGERGDRVHLRFGSEFRQLVKVRRSRPRSPRGEQPGRAHRAQGPVHDEEEPAGSGGANSARDWSAPCTRRRVRACPRRAGSSRRAVPGGCGMPRVRAAAMNSPASQKVAVGPCEHVRRHGQRTGGGRAVRPGERSVSARGAHGRGPEASGPARRARLTPCRGRGRAGELHVRAARLAVSPRSR